MGMPLLGETRIQHITFDLLYEQWLFATYVKLAM